MDLILVESPTKAKKIQGFLGKKYKVTATIGHFRDLPVDDLGVDVENGFLPNYVTSDKKKKMVARIKKSAASADNVYLAADDDREGEAIAYHCKSVLNLKKYKRIIFKEITEKAVKHAINNPVDLDMKRVAAQEARRVSDRLVGYIISPILCDQSNTNLSAGRVQSPALNILAIRDKEIKNFTPTEYYELTAKVEGVHLNCVNANLSDEKHITDKSIFDDILKNTTELKITTQPGNKKTIKVKPCFTTSKLQQSASSSLAMSPKETMKAAQKLFENGFISYHRTDSPNLSADKYEELVSFLETKDYEVRDSQLTYKVADDAQLGHEAIAPVDFNVTTVTGEGLGKNEQLLYDLIHERTILSGLKDGTDTTCKLLAISDHTHEGNPVEFVLNDTQVLVPGWRDHLHLEKKPPAKNSQTIPSNLKDTYPKEEFRLHISNKSTKAPSRYKAADLIKVLETLKIGRPSTYANIIENLFDRGYIIETRKFLEVTDTGIRVVNALKDMFFMNLKFTQIIEKQLDQVATGDLTYLDVVKQNFELIEKNKHTINFDRKGFVPPKKVKTKKPKAKR